MRWPTHRKDREEKGRGKKALYVLAYKPRFPLTHHLVNALQLPPIPTHASAERSLVELAPSPLSTSNGPSSARPPLTPEAPYPQSSPSRTSDVGRGLPTFGVYLAEQMLRDGVELPKVVEKCCTAIAQNGLEVVGIYRLSGTTSKIQKLKQALDRGSSNAPFSVCLISVCARC